MNLKSEQAKSIHSLWDQLSDFPVAETDAALLHLLRTICQWIEADDGFWVGTVRLDDTKKSSNDPAHGWRARVIRHLVETPAVAHKFILSKKEDFDPGLAVRALTANAGTFRMQRMHDGFIDITAFKTNAHFQIFYESTGIQDRMWIVFPVTEDTESYFLFDRIRSSRRFTAREMELAAYTLRGIKWFHRNLMLSHGLQLVTSPLTPLEREILHLLLTNKTEKEIAATLEQSPGTTHKYITGIFRKFDVKGRTGLTAMWLRGC